MIPEDPVIGAPPTCPEIVRCTNCVHIGEPDRGEPGMLTYGLASCEICDFLDAFLAPITHHYQYLLANPKKKETTRAS